MNMVGETYKFVLAFENNLCDDYVTEKVWKPLHVGTVPIVLGAYNYSSLFPPKSYIDIKDFKSPRDLADYMLLLDRNDRLYNEYFKWRETYRIKPHEPSYCRVCEYLNKSKNTTKIYNNLDSFWNKTRDL